MQNQQCHIPIQIYYVQFLSLNADDDNLDTLDENEYTDEISSDDEEYQSNDYEEDELEDENYETLYDSNEEEDIKGTEYTFYDFNLFLVS